MKIQYDNEVKTISESTEDELKQLSKDELVILVKILDYEANREMKGKPMPIYWFQSNIIQQRL